MTPGKFDVVVGNLVTILTRHLMDARNLSMEEAFGRLYGTEFYALLSDADSRLFLEEDDFLKRCVDIELDSGVDALYAFIRPRV